MSLRFLNNGLAEFLSDLGATTLCLVKERGEIILRKCFVAYTVPNKRFEFGISFGERDHRRQLRPVTRPEFLDPISSPLGNTSVVAVSKCFEETEDIFPRIQIISDCFGCESLIFRTFSAMRITAQAKAEYDESATWMTFHDAQRPASAGRNGGNAAVAAPLQAAVRSHFRSEYCA